VAEAGRDTAKRTWIRIAWGLPLAAVLLLAPAGTLWFWQGWVYWFVYSSSVVLITGYFLKHDPELVERRLRAGPAAEKERSQKVIQSIANVLFILEVVVPGWEYRVHGPDVPVGLAIASDFLVALGFWIVFLAFKENSFASAVIEVSQGQRVISTGPYRMVRHPMYAGALLMLGFTPLALGSYRAMIVVPFTVLVIVWRLLDEEKYLVGQLAGYEEYQRATRYRLIPYIW